MGTVPSVPGWGQRGLSPSGAHAAPHARPTRAPTRPARASHAPNAPTRALTLARTRPHTPPPCARACTRLPSCTRSSTRAPHLKRSHPMPVHSELRDGVAVVTLDNAPVNALDHATRRALGEALDAHAADPAVRAIVITGANALFSGGADIKEFNTPKMAAEPTLRTLVVICERSPKPVIAAIGGTCMGGGLELSLGCHYRVAAADAQLALPEVKLGLLPGGGGTQRLPRAVGVEAAVNFITTGNTVPAAMVAKFPGQKLVDRIAPSDALLDTAIAFATEIADVRPLPLLRDIPARHPNADAFFGFARNTVRAMAPGYPAPLACVDCIQQATKLGMDEGLAYERTRFIELMMGPESRALRHIFFGERAAKKIPGVAEDTPLRPVKSVGIIGAGLMGSGIATNFVAAGIPVVLIDTKQEAVDRGVTTIRRNQESQVKKGKLTAEQLEQRMTLVTPALDHAALASVDLVIEAVFEDLAVKTSVFASLDTHCKPGAILATNTSTLDIDAIAAATSRPQDVVGLHFFSPAHVMKLLEIVRGAKTAPDVLATAMALSKTLKKTAVVAGNCDGFIGNRMIEQYGRQAGFLLDEGCTPAQVDAAAEKFGFAMGPFRMADLAGNDIAQAIRTRRRTTMPDMKYSGTADKLCALGRFGQKTGAGWYDYQPGRRDAIPSPLVEELVVSHRAEIGITPRHIADDEIVQRLVYALVNEGAHILGEGIAARASDIDLVYLYGYGFPVPKGGPMLYADQQGLPVVARTMHDFARNPHADPAFWTPAPLLARLAAEGGSFN